MYTKQANPNLASQAPKVNKINNKNNSVEEVWDININPKVRITPSNAIKDINKWRRWVMKASKEEITINLIEAQPKTNII